MLDCETTVIPVQKEKKNSNSLNRTKSFSESLTITPGLENRAATWRVVGQPDVMAQIGSARITSDLSVTRQQLHSLAQMMTATSKKIDRFLQSKPDISLMAPSSLLSTRQRDVAPCLAENQRGQR